MALRTASIYRPRDGGEVRFSIMSRHTLDDGVTPDPKITRESYDAWWPELAPPPSLIGAYYKRGLSWEAFKEKFAHYLLSPDAQQCLILLAEISHHADITILCKEKNPERCHRRLVAEACREIEPSLQIIIE